MRAMPGTRMKVPGVKASANIRTTPTTKIISPMITFPASYILDNLLLLANLLTAKINRPIILAFHDKGIANQFMNGSDLNNGNPVFQQWRQS